MDLGNINPAVTMILHLINGYPSKQPQCSNTGTMSFRAKWFKMVFMLVQSFHEANNLDMLIVAMKGIVRLFFTLDYVHYARWMSVFMQILALFH